MINRSNFVVSCLLIFSYIISMFYFYLQMWFAIQIVLYMHVLINASAVLFTQKNQKHLFY